jgi:hypothetical protein
MVLVLLSLVFVAAPIPLMDELFGLRPLQQPADYLPIGLAVVAWTCGAVLLWRLRPVEWLEQRFCG